MKVDQIRDLGERMPQRQLPLTMGRKIYHTPNASVSLVKCERLKYVSIGDGCGATVANAATLEVHVLCQLQGRRDGLAVHHHVARLTRDE